MKSDFRALPSGSANPFDDLYKRPGFKIRRAHQIGVSIFEELSGGGLTTTQHAALFILSARPGLDQIGLAKLIGHDRSTTALVVSKLERAGYIERRADAADRRRKMLLLTDEGHAALAQCIAISDGVSERLLSVFTPHEAEEMQRLLSKLVDAFNDKIRTPIQTEP